MKKITFFIISIILILGLYFYFRSEPGTTTVAKKIFKIGVVNTAAALKPAFEGLKIGMAELGHEEGGDITYSYQEVAGSKEKAQEAVRGFINEKYDLIVPIGVIPAVAARQATQELSSQLPVVFVVVSDPVGAGLVKTLLSSGNNITGVTPANEVVSAKRLELFKELVPNLKRVIFPYNDPKTTGIEKMKEAASVLKIEFFDKRVLSPEELDLFLDSLTFKENDGFLRATDSTVSVRLKKIVDLTLKKKIPLAGTNINDVKEGALMSYGANYFEIGQQSANLVHKILIRGERPADIPVELPRRYELAINLNTAREINLSPDPDFLSKVDVIINK